MNFVLLADFRILVYQHPLVMWRQVFSQRGFKNMKFEVYVTTVENDSEEEVEEKIYNDAVEIFYYGSEISDIMMKPIKSKK